MYGVKSLSVLATVTGLVGLTFLNGAYAVTGSISVYLVPNSGSGDGPCSDEWLFGTYDMASYYGQTINFPNAIGSYQISGVDSDSTSECDDVKDNGSGFADGYTLYAGGCSESQSTATYGDCEDTGCVDTSGNPPVCLVLDQVAGGCEFQGCGKKRDTSFIGERSMKIDEKLFKKPRKA